MTSIRTDEPSQTLPERRSVPGRRSFQVLEVLGLLLSPVVAFVVLGVREMARPNMIDPYFYSAFAQQGSEMLARFGTENYFWVRVGFILPARAFTVAFGPVGGFYAFRYALALLAVIPAYLLLRRLHGRAAGAVAVAVLLASPVVWHAWLTDYPDAAAVSYLVAATACLVMPSASVRSRLAWVAASGVLATFAVHSQLMAAPVVVGVVGGWLLAGLWRVRRSTVVTAVAEVLVLAVVFLAGTRLLMVAADAVLGSGDLITPTAKAIERLETPEERAKWNSEGVDWVFRNTYLFVLPVVVAAWALLVTRLPSRLRAPGPRRTAPTDPEPGPSRSEAAVVLGTALSGIAYVYVQFGRDGSTLDYFLYSSMLWPGICLTTALVVVRLTRSLRGRFPGAAAAGAVVLVAGLLSWPLDMPTFDMWPVGCVLALAVLVACVLGRVGRRSAPVVVSALVLSLAALFALTVGKPSERPLLEGQVVLPPAYYDDVLATDGSAELDAFRVAAEVPDVVGDPRFDRDLLFTWAPPDQPLAVAQAAAQYLWLENGLPYDLPELSQEDAEYLYSRKPRHLVFLGSSDERFEAGLQALEPFGVSPEVERTAVLRSGDSVVHVWVVRLATFDDVPPA